MKAWGARRAVWLAGLLILAVTMVAGGPGAAHAADCCPAPMGSWNGLRDDDGVLYFPGRGAPTRRGAATDWRPDPLNDFDIVTLGTVQEQKRGGNRDGNWILSTVRVVSRIKGEPPRRFRVLEFLPKPGRGACPLGPILEKQRRYVFLVNTVSKDRRAERTDWLHAELGVGGLPKSDYVLDDVFAVDYAYNRVWYEYWLRFPASRKPPRKPESRPAVTKPGIKPKA